MGVAAPPLRQDKGPRPQKQQLLFLSLLTLTLENMDCLDLLSLNFSRERWRAGDRNDEGNDDIGSSLIITINNEYDA
jgi:hypothetical protein